MVGHGEPYFVPAPVHYTVPEFFAAFFPSIPPAPWMIHDVGPFTSVAIGGRRVPTCYSEVCSVGPLTHLRTSSCPRDGWNETYKFRARGIVALAGGIP